MKESPDKDKKPETRRLLVLTPRRKPDTQTQQVILRTKMPGKKNPFQGIGEGITKVTCETAWANVEIAGTGAHASNALKRAGWDAKTPMAAVMMTVNNGSIQGTEWILRGSLGDVVVPLQRVQEDKLMKATLNLNDLSKIKFPMVTNPTGGGPNHSVWMEGADVTTSLTFGGTSLTPSRATTS